MAVAQAVRQSTKFNSSPNFLAIRYSVAVYKHSEEYKGQPVPYSHTSGLITISTATSCSSAQHCGHTPGCITITVTCMLAAPYYVLWPICPLYSSKSAGAYAEIVKEGFYIGSTRSICSWKHASKIFQYHVNSCGHTD